MERMMRSLRSARAVCWVALAFGCLFSGPCGITSLQLQDFLVSSTIRTAVTTLAGVVQAALVEAGSTQP